MYNTLPRLIMTTLVLSIIAGFWVVYDSQDVPSPLATKSATPIRVGSYTGLFSSLIWIAEAQGYFTDQNLDVTLSEFATGVAPVQALLRGEVDLATAAEFVLVRQSFDHPDLRAIVTLDIANAIELIARRDRGIAKPRDLKGKTIGVVQKSQSEFFLGGFLMLHGLEKDDIQVVNLSPSQIINAITTGDIDAAMIWEPNIYQIQQRLGSNAISFPGQDEQDFYFLLIGRAPFLESSPEITRRFVHALRQAETFLQHHRTEGQTLIAQRLHTDLDFIQTMWAKNRFRITLPQALLIAMEDEARWYIQQENTGGTAIPNYLNFLSVNALEQVAPEAVTIIR